MTYTLKESIAKMESYCTYQDRCHSEVEQKLWTLKISSEYFDEIMLHLVSNKYLDEERFARSFVRGKFNYKKWGRQKIKAHLKQKKVSDFCINKGLEEINEAEYLKTLEQLIEKNKSKIKDKSDFEVNQKVARQLIAKGYESNLVWESILD